ncbi:hypothetical protein [Gimesia chilikensis]|uniref:Uncharacterized protein n=1 Tax=Gimesia chilikensis TaxID=2605989 RepID=A0A517PLH4_9PLAN|nr:hypothetical protein [Gimesia chilikensis]QDT20212.1 hypothetical protein HG66A1_19970 [Gimesia chilikensis]
MSEFTLLNKQGVKSDQGFEVQMVNRHCIEYREGDLVLSIEVEMGMNGEMPCLLYSPEDLSMSHNAEAVRPIDRTRIEENFRRAMEFLGVLVIAESPE